MMNTDITMREPCSFCNSTYGKRTDINGQATIRCSNCDRWLYNAPKAELGEEQRHVRGRPSIKPKQRIRIVSRANGMCELCGLIPARKDGGDGILEVAHILSVHESKGTDITLKEENSDDNLACLCETCNKGMGDLSFTPILYLRLIRKRMGNAD